MRERRRWPRVALIAQIAHSPASMPMLRQITDISHGGVFVDTATPLPEGQAVQLRFALPNQEEPMTVEAAVAWNQSSVGMGLRFTRVAPQDQAVIDGFVQGSVGPLP
jgi:uncharacterized protein (TIGR02266 family)